MLIPEELTADFLALLKDLEAGKVVRVKMKLVPIQGTPFFKCVAC